MAFNMIAKKEETDNVKTMFDAKKMSAKRDYSGIMDDVQKRGRGFFFIKLLRIIIKNYKLIIRTRISALIFLLGPLIIMALVSIGFNTSTLYGVNIAAFSESYSPLAETLIANLSSGEYGITKTPSEQECMDFVKLSRYPVCIIFPKDMAMDNSARNVITLYIDESRVNIANAISEKLSAKVELQASELSAGAVSQILGALDNINRETEAGKSAALRLTTNNAEEAAKLSDSVDKIASIDFNAGTLDASAATTEISSIQDDLNLSSSVFSTLTSHINSMVSSYNSLKSTLDTAKTKAGEAQTSAQEAKNKVNADTSIIKDANNRFGNIKTSIEGVKITNVDAIVSPLKISVQPLTKTKNYFLYILPSLLILLIMLVSLLISSTGVIREKESSASLRNFITPTGTMTFLLAHYLTYISIIFVQTMLIMGVISIFVKGIAITTYLLAAAFMLVFATVFIFIGMFIGTIFNTGETATVASVSVAIITLVFSNAIMPLEILSGFLRTMVEYNPFVMMEGILKGLILFESALAGINHLYVLFGFIAVVAAATVIAQTMRERNMN
ncbi:MAG: ABC transporter permease [Candidatus Nanoarchaeia archaeon]|nr:ABC transporter permease [Candidatus Nanoarchaeia archaeon]